MSRLFFLLDLILFHVLSIAMLLQCWLDFPPQDTISLSIVSGF